MRIGTTEMRNPGDFWRIIMEKEEFEHQNCVICGEKFKETQEVYTCEHCKKIFHRSCVSDSFGNVIGSLFPCLHLTKKEYQYYCGRIIMEKTT